MKHTILIVLGSPNAPNGKLSNISKNRLDYCLKIYSKKDHLVLCSGGWGEHFNTSSKPHAYYAKNYLLSKGVLEKDFLEHAISSNTVDDAVKIKPIVKKTQCTHLIIVTSDYHVERVELIFKEILNSFKLTFFGADSNLESHAYESLVNHEKKAIQSILKHGLYY